MSPSSISTTNRLSLVSDRSETTSLLERCSKIQELKQIHGRLLKTGLVQDPVAVTKLLTFCISTDSGNFLPYAQKLFNGIDRPNTFIWNLMIRGYSENEEPEKALLLYRQMLLHSVSHNEYTFPFLIKACSNLSETKQIHTQIIKFGFSKEVYATNSLIHAYVMTGNLHSANLVFLRISEGDIVSWNSMIKGCLKIGVMETAMEFFRNMPEKNVVSWTTMISGFVRAGMNEEAIELFQEMQNSGIEPDIVALSSALSACAQLGALEQGKWIHEYITKRRIQTDSVMGCVLIDMYAKCGDIEQALDVFRKMKNKKHVHAWTAVISGLANHGYGRVALEYFAEMQNTGIKPNTITFTAVLTACSYSGLVEEGKSLFNSMEKKYNLKPTIEHYGCMVDLLGRAGFLDEAKVFIEKMPLKPNVVIWGSLLKACQVHRNTELGKEIGKILIEMDPYQGGRYVDFANVHAMGGKWDRAVEARTLMKERGVWKIPGCSAISVNGNVHEFLAGGRVGGRSRPEIEKIH